MDKKDTEDPKLEGFRDDNIDTDIIAENSKNDKTKKIIYIIIIIVVSILIIGGVIFFFLYKNSQSEPNQKSSSEKEELTKAQKYFEEGSYTKSLDSGNKCISFSSEIGCYFIVIESSLKLKKFDKIEEQLKNLETLIKKENNKEYSEKFTSLKSKVTTEKLTFEKYISLYPDSAGYIPKFYQTFFEQGGKIYDNEIYFNEVGLRGVMATKDIEKGSIITEIPLDMLIKQSDVFEYMKQKLAERENKTTKSVERVLYGYYCPCGELLALGLYLLENKDNRTEENYRLYDYIQMMLSSGYDEFPTNYNEKLVGLINETSLYQRIKLQRQNLESCFRSYKSSFNKTFSSNEELYSLQNIINIYLAINSRIFGDVINNKAEAALVPYLDMLNHNKSKNADWRYDNERKGFVCRSNTKIKKGAEIYDSYGEFRSNSELLLFYGFTDGDNTDQDEIFISYNGRTYTIRQYLRKINETNKDNYNKTITENELIYMIDSIKDGSIRYGKTTKGGFSKKEVEIETMDRIYSMMKRHVNRFSQTLEEDEETFRKKQDKMNFNEINIYRIRIGEKRIANWLVNFAEKLKSYFQEFPDGDEEFDEKVAKDFSTINDTDIKSYLEVALNATEIIVKNE